MDNPESNLQGVDEFYIQAMLLAKVVKRTLKQRANFDLSCDPIIELTPVVSFRKRMRIWSIDKFEGQTYISTVNYYLTDEDKKNGKAIGAIVLYLGEEFISYLFKRMGYPKLNEDETEELEDACGTFCNIIAAKFKSGLTQLGYQEPVMSHFKSYRSEIMDGVAFDHTQTNKYEIAFEINDMRRIVVDLSMGLLPKTTDPIV